MSPRGAEGDAAIQKEAKLGKIMIGLLPARMLAVAMTKKAAISLQIYCEELATKQSK